MTPDDLAAGVVSGQVVLPGYVEANYARACSSGPADFDGRMAYSSNDRHRRHAARPAPVKLEDWARQHRSEMDLTRAERGARLDVRDTVWHGTPLGWARQSGGTQMAELLVSLAR